MESSTAKRRNTAWLLIAALAFTGFHTLGATVDRKAAPLHLPGKLHCPLCLNPFDQAILPAGVAPPAWHTLLPTSLVQPQPAETRSVIAHALAQSRAPPSLFLKQLE
jgi:hypothetical protein